MTSLNEPSVSVRNPMFARGQSSLANKDPLEEHAFVSQRPGMTSEQSKRQDDAMQSKTSEIMRRDQRPLPEDFRGKYGAQPWEIPPRWMVKELLHKELRRLYPFLDHCMSLILVEHYLDHPHDTPEKMLQRVPKNEDGSVKLPEPEKKEEEGFHVEGPPGGRGQLKGDHSDEEQKEDEEEVTPSEEDGEPEQKEQGPEQPSPDEETPTEEDTPEQVEDGPPSEGDEDLNSDEENGEPDENVEEDKEVSK